MFHKPVIPARIIIIDVTVLATLYSISSQSIPKKNTIAVQVTIKEKDQVRARA